MVLSVHLTPREEIQIILQERISFFKKNIKKLKSYDGQTVLQNMQIEFEKNQGSRLLFSITKLKSQNKYIGNEFEKTIMQVPSLHPNPATIKLMLSNVSQLLVKEGITPDLATQLIEDAQEFLEEVLPKNLPKSMDRSISDMQEILQNLNNGKNITEDLIQLREQARRTTPLMKLFRVQLKTYKEIMGEDISSSVRIDLNSITDEFLNGGYCANYKDLNLG